MSNPDRQILFAPGEIWAYPTDTSFALGARADDPDALEKLFALKGGRDGKYFSLMCADEAMLRRFAEVPADFDVHGFFFEKPRTALFAPSAALPRSRFWPEEKVAWRVTTFPELAELIPYPVTATSANRGGEPPIFTAGELRRLFGERIRIFDELPALPERKASEIWDCTTEPPARLR